MMRFLKAVFGLSLILTMIVSMVSIASGEAAGSIKVNGHIMGIPESSVQYHIHYDANGGTGSYEGPDITAGEADKVCSLSQTGIERGGYTFTGWDTKTDGGGTSYAPGDTVILNSDVTLYAQWANETAGGSLTNGSKAAASSTPKTGDTVNLSLWITLSCMYITAMVFFLWGERRDKRKNLH